MTQPTYNHMSAEERADRLNQAITLAVADRWQVESRSQHQAVLTSGSPTNHLLHFLVTVFTFGLWLPFWLLMALTSTQKRTVATVDESGVVHWSEPVQF
jgi:hypothetical protein